MPAIPTTEYIILLTVEVAPPNKAATKSNWNKPTESQTTAPTITNVNAILSKPFLATENQLLSR